VVATDVAARGIHIRRLKYVVNYDFPGSLEQYCHRVGRTGRTEGESGFSYSLLTRNLAPLAEDLISLLLNCSQVIEPNLTKLVADFKNGLVDVNAEEMEADGGEGSGVEVISDDDVEGKVF
jgi:superfamily II DNA/RNA helicase